jgi:hypothetical protein
MASSVSSERTFSAAGITLSKRRNRLKGDIVEALECLKCLLHRDLIFREVVTAADLEKELESVDDDDGETGSSAEIIAETNEFSWDQVLDDVEDEGDDEIESFE